MQFGCMLFPKSSWRGKRQVHITTKNQQENVLSSNLHLDAGCPNLIQNLSCQLAAKFLKLKEQNGERSENNAKLKTFFTFVYNSEVARIKYVYLVLCIFFFTAILKNNSSLSKSRVLPGRIWRKWSVNPLKIVWKLCIWLIKEFTTWITFSKSPWSPSPIKLRITSLKTPLCFQIL